MWVCTDPMKVVEYVRAHGCIADNVCSIYELYGQRFGIGIDLRLPLPLVFAIIDLCVCICVPATVHRGWCVCVCACTQAAGLMTESQALL